MEITLECKKFHYRLQRQHLSTDEIKLAETLDVTDKFLKTPESVFSLGYNFFDDDGEFDTDLYTRVYLHHVESTRQTCVAKQAFLNANPHVKPRKDTAYICGHFFSTGRACQFHVNCEDIQFYSLDGYHSAYCDHPTQWKTSSAVKDVFVIAHPYNLPKPDCPKLPSHIQCVRKPRQYSWHNPRHDGTFLVFLGRRDIINTLNLDYTVPDFNNLRPRSNISVF